MGADRAQDIIDQIAEEAWGDAESADPEVREVVVARFQVGWNSRTSAMLLGSAGGYTEYPLFVADGLFDELKSLMASVDGGAWFTFRLQVTRDEMTVECDYDNAPAFISLILSPEDVDVELTNWPRDPDRTPEWLTAILDQFA